MLHDLLARPMAKQPLGYIRVHCVDPDLFLRILHDTADTHAACRSLEKWLGRGHRQGQGDVGAVVPPARSLAAVLCGNMDAGIGLAVNGMASMTVVELKCQMQDSRGTKSHRLHKVIVAWHRG